MDKDDIKQAIKLLRENGYIVKRFTPSMRRASDECEASGWEMDCCGCPCNICIIQ